MSTITRLTRDKDMQNTNNPNYLGEKAISRLLLKFSIPCILSLLISLLYNIVDKIFIGNSALGTNGSAAIGVSFATPIIAIAFAWLFGDGTATFMSVAQGKQDTQKVSKAVAGAILSSLIMSFVLVAIFIPLRSQVLSLFGADSNSLPLAKEYFVIVVSALPLYMVANTMNAIIRADGSPTYALISMAIGAILKIVFDAVFIIALDLGIKGAAGATVIGQGVSFILCSIYFARSKTFKLSLKDFKVDFKVLFSAIKLGLPTLVTQLAVVAMSLACSIVFKKYGAQSKYGSTIAIAAMTDENTIFTFILNIVIGIVLGAQPIISYNVGAKNYQRVSDTFLITFGAVFVVALIATILSLCCPQVFYTMFGNEDPLYIELERKIYRYFLSTFILTATIKMISIFLQSCGSPIKSAIVTIVRDILCFVVLIVTIPINLGLDGALIAPPIGDAIAITVAVGLIVDYFVKFKKTCNNPTTI